MENQNEFRICPNKGVLRGAEDYHAELGTSAKECPPQKKLEK